MIDGEDESSTIPLFLGLVVMCCGSCEVYVDELELDMRAHEL